MIKDRWMNIGVILKMNARNVPEKIGWQDRNRMITFHEWNERACRFANGLEKMKVRHGERFAVLSYNRGEWMDIYAGAAKGGQVVVPVLFRHEKENIIHIVNHSQCRAFIVEHPFVEKVDAIRHKLKVDPDRFIYLGDGPVPEGYVEFETFLESADAFEPTTRVCCDDVWTFMHTSGTTGKPKAVVRTHESYMAEYYLDIANMGVRSTDKCLLVMPMCHVNSLFYSFPYTLVTATVVIYNISSFDPMDLLKTFEKYKITFTSLVPTHYRMILDIDEDERKGIDVSRIRQLLISSAPADINLKHEIMGYFKNAELWEAYGTTEGGLVTLLRPEDQLSKLGSVGKEIMGIDQIKLLGENGEPVEEGEPGELWYRTPMIFKEYWQEPEKTAAAFRDGWSSAGDIAIRDPDGYYFLVDRKENMIITGGENVYPREIENVVMQHVAVKEAAVIGIPDRKWGEVITAVVILKRGYRAGEVLALNIIEFCKTKLEHFKKPRCIAFIPEEEMPRNTTGKILHRALRNHYRNWTLYNKN